MDFLKKHWEKILLTTALLILIGAAVVLVAKVEAVRNELADAPRRPRQKGEPATPVDRTPYVQAMEQLKNPFQWDGEPLAFVPANIKKFEPDTGTHVVARVECKVLLQRIVRIPFKMNFKAYIGDGRNFQVDLRGGALTFFVENVGEFIRNREVNTGYKIIRFDKKSTTVFDPSLNREIERDISELTVQRPDDKPVVLTLGREAVEEEPVATVVCQPTSPRDGEPSTIRVRRGQSFSCCDRTYNVVDISSRQMIIKDAVSEEKRLIDLTAPVE